MSAVPEPEHISELAPTSLSDPTHPIFQIFNSGKFHLPCAGSHTVVQLLAHFQAQALYLTHAILLTAPVSYEPDGPKGARLAVLPEPRASAAELTDEERELTMRHLATILHHCDVVVGPNVGHCGGATSWRPERAFTHIPGRGSTITIGVDNIEKINDAFATGNVLAQQYYIFNLARVLFHEIGHVLTFARLPTSMKGNCYLGDAVTCEIGFELESKLFGFIFQDDNGEIFGPDSNNYLDFLISGTEWPYPPTLDSYRVETGITNIYTRGAPVDRTARKWKVPFAYINRMFQDEFWANLTPSGPDSLKFHPMVGYIVKFLPRDSPEEPVQMYLMDPDHAVNLPYVPADFKSDHEGLLRRQ